MDTTTLFSSIASSLASRIVCYPLDTIAIQHASSMRRPIFSQPFLSYYRGLGASCLIVTPAVAVYLTTYRQAKSFFLPKLGDGAATYVAAGMAAEITSSVLWTPLEVIKNRLQIARAADETGLVSNVRSILSNEGIRGLYRGYLLGLVVFIPYNAIWWTSYEYTKKTYASQASKVGLGGGRSNTVQSIYGAMVATTSSILCLHPIDLLKTRYQVATSNTVVRSGRDDRAGLRSVIRNLGWRGIYKGLGPRLMCSVPSSMISMAVFEYLCPEKRDTSNSEDTLPLSPKQTQRSTSANMRIEA